MKVHSSACGMTGWLKYKSYISSQSWPSSASEQMHRYLRCAFSETNCFLSLTAEVFLSAAVVNYSAHHDMVKREED